MDQKSDKLPLQDVMDSPSANTRSKDNVIKEENNSHANKSQNVTPKKEIKSTTMPSKNTRTPAQAVRSPNSAKGSKSSLSEIRRAALKKKRDAVAKGSTALQQAIYDPDATAREAKHIIRSETGIVFDDLMERHFCPWDENHVERPERLQCIRQRIDELGLTERCKKVRIFIRVRDSCIAVIS